MKVKIKHSKFRDAASSQDGVVQIGFFLSPETRKKWTGMYEKSIHRIMKPKIPLGKTWLNTFSLFELS
jgi:hypothetical protein